MQDAEGKVCFLVRSMIEEWENSARTMIYHLRYVLRAFSPFQQARKDMEAVRKQGHLDDDAASYLSTAVSLLEKRGKQILIQLHGNSVITPNPSITDQDFQ